MDVAELTTFLTPFLPFLVKAGERAAEEAGARFGAEAWLHAQRLWHRLWPSVESKEGALEAADDAASRPEDGRARVALELQLEKLLASDEALAKDIEQLWASAKAANVVTASGARSVAVGRDAKGIFVTGDDAQIG